MIIPPLMKMADDKDIKMIVSEVRKQHFLSSCLYFQVTDEVKNTITKYPNTHAEFPFLGPPQSLVPGLCNGLSALPNGMPKNSCGPNELESI